MATRNDSSLVDWANAEQAKAWDGNLGTFWAAHADMYERCIERFDDAMLAAADIVETSRVLDIGCGTGSTARAAARLASRGGVVGIDLSTVMLDAARQMAAQQGIANIQLVRGDAQVHDLGTAVFDAAIARTSLMFFADLRATLANVRQALRPGGRLSAIVWQESAANEWFREIVGALAGGRELPGFPDDAPHPFNLADPQRCRAVLSGAGFTDISIEPCLEPMRFGADATEGMALIRGQWNWLLDDLDPTARQRVEDAVRATLERHEQPDGVLFGSAAWLLSARA